MHRCMPDMAYGWSKSSIQHCIGTEHNLTALLFWLCVMQTSTEG